MMLYGNPVWDALWSNKGLPDWDTLSEDILRALLREVGPVQGRCLVEAGSGSGRISLDLASRGAAVTLVDLSPVALAVARERFQRAARQAVFLRADIRDMPLPDASFDVAWSAGVLEHLPAPGRRRALAEMGRVVRPGGRVIAVVPFARCLIYRIGKWWSERSGDWPYGREEPLDTLGPDLAAAGLRLEREYSFGFEHSFYFIDFIADAGPFKDVVARWYAALDADERARLDGYLLMSVSRRP
jgi:SAM-dependent methyltransferase